LALVSVVTPVYNGSKYLRSCIESVLCQTFSDWEYVIVDNGSSDDSRSIAESYASDKRLRIHSNGQVLPVTLSFNRAASLVSPGIRYLKFLCADDLLFPQCLELMLRVAESNPHVSLVGSYKIHGTQPVFEGPPFPQEVVPGREVCKWFFQGRLGILGSETNHLIRLPVEGAGSSLFDPTFSKHSDTELFVRLLKDRGEMGFVHQVLTFTRVHAGSVSVKQAHILGTGHLEALAILNKHGPDFLTHGEMKTLLQTRRRAYFRFLFRSLFKSAGKEIWRYHRSNWPSLGIYLSSCDMARVIAVGAAMCAVHPLDSLNRLRREISRRASRTVRQRIDG